MVKLPYGYMRDGGGERSAWSREDTVSKYLPIGAGGVAQYYSLCLVGTRPWISFPELEWKEERKFI